MVKFWWIIANIRIIWVFKFYDRVVQKRVPEACIIFIFFLFTVDSLLLSNLSNNGESFYLIVNLSVGRRLVLFCFCFFFHFFRIQYYWFPCQCVLENFQLDKIAKRLHHWASHIMHVYILLYVTHLYIDPGTCIVLHGCEITHFSYARKKIKILVYLSKIMLASGKIYYWIHQIL